MNIPVGKVEESQVSFAEKPPFARIRQLLQSGFEGYMAATIEGASGLEESIILLRGKEIVAAVFDAIRMNKQFYGIDGLKLALNLLKSQKGVFDLCRLSKQQIDLIIAFNEKVALPKPVDAGTLSKLEPAGYSSELVSKELAVDLGASDSKASLLKRLGLSSI